MKAIVVVDIQNDFLPGGSLAVPEGDCIIERVNMLIGHSGLVVATQDWHPADHGSFAVRHDGKKPGDIIDLHGVSQILWPVHCVQHTYGAEFSAKLFSERFDAVFRKGMDPGVDSYSSFFDNDHKTSTGMGEFLRNKGVNNIYVCGLATDYCVKYTCLDAVSLGFRTWVITDVTMGVNVTPGDAEKAYREMTDAGVRLIESRSVYPE